MRITKKMIVAAENRLACSQALDWLRARPRTLKQLVDYSSNALGQEGFSWLAWALSFRGIFTKEQRVEARKLYQAKRKEIADGN